MAQYRAGRMDQAGEWRHEADALLVDNRQGQPTEGPLFVRDRRRDRFIPCHNGVPKFGAACWSPGGCFFGVGPLIHGRTGAHLGTP